MTQVKRKIAFQGEAHKRRAVAKNDANHQLAAIGARYPGGIALLAGSNPGESVYP